MIITKGWTLFYNDINTSNEVYDIVDNSFKSPKTLSFYKNINKKTCV